MKKIILSLMVVLMALGAVITMSSCSPTAGLEEIDYEDIANANLAGTYTCTTKTIIYNSDGTTTSNSTEPTSLSGSSVKAAIALSKVSVDTIKAMSPKSSGRVCANANFTKIVTYVYTRNSEGNLIQEYIATYIKN